MIPDTVPTFFFQTLAFKTLSCTVATSLYEYAPSRAARREPVTSMKRNLEPSQEHESPNTPSKGSSAHYDTPVKAKAHGAIELCEAKIFDI